MGMHGRASVGAGRYGHTCETARVGASVPGPSFRSFPLVRSCKSLASLKIGRYGGVHSLTEVGVWLSIGNLTSIWLWASMDSASGKLITHGRHTMTQPRARRLTMQVHGDIGAARPDHAYADTCPCRRCQRTRNVCAHLEAQAAREYGAPGYAWV